MIMTARTSKATTGSILLTLVGVICFKNTSSFVPLAEQGCQRLLGNKLYSVENWISGVTNSPPSKPLLSKGLEDSLTMGTSLQNKELACVYKASRDGWSAVDFHKCVDGKGSALVVALSRSGKIFGGFNPLGWRSTDDYYQSNAAFLWFVGNTSNKEGATRCPILTGGM